MAPRRPRTGSLGNQNNRRTGIYSRIDPPSDDELAALARAAVAAGDHRELHAVARGIRTKGQRLRQGGRPAAEYQPYYDRASGLRAIARDLERQAAAADADAVLHAHRTT